MGKGEYRILVIHPDAAVGEELSRYLHKLTGSIEYCPEGVEGIRRCYQQRYDMVLVARWLKDMDAFELVEKVRLRDRKIPFIILVESMNKALFQKAKQLGRCTLCWHSPDPRTLESFLEKVLSPQCPRILRKS